MALQNLIVGRNLEMLGQHASRHSKGYHHLQLAQHNRQYEASIHIFFSLRISYNSVYLLVRVSIILVLC